MAYAEHLRRYFPAVRGVTYLNTAYAGALPEASVSAMQAAHAQAGEEGRLEVVQTSRLAVIRQQLREHLAHLLHTNPSTIALTTGAAHALSLVLWGLTMQPGEEILYAGLGDPDLLLPLYTFRQRSGVVIRHLTGFADGDALVAQVKEALTQRTRLVVVAQVDHRSGRRLPVEAVGEVCRARGVPLVVDGTYGAGADPVDLAGGFAMAYLVDGRRWLCGPFGVGALVIQPGWWSALQPAWAGEPALAEPAAIDAWGGFLLAPDARRFEGAALEPAVWTGWLESLRFLRGQAGWDLVFTRVMGLTGEALDGLLDLAHVRVWTPRDARAGMIALEVAGHRANALAEAARSRGIDLGVTPDGRGLRVSFGLYNHSEDVARLLKWLAETKPESPSKPAGD
ncbi:aminotransferase class V-fold PLP-dependent enzyme [Alicyclobacillus sp.]|uniref:aminotransferase class V-fold PLP-dependent enzyme n=1 Tax=Alicyclobacillus sp. TaxID=61169 RepID=UPI0025C4D1B2|nr:aminotransferase class V-fold PLP-dependent enzyme [Alicyclobacillus sp.]MCL6516389.1 aminotransferase class V-fold PLP-dependent enzyme [Alicyclobacillus sp.]